MDDANYKDSNFSFIKKKRTQILENKNAMPKIEMMEKKNEWTVGVLKDRINK